jgi:hypothetical protein
VGRWTEGEEDHSVMSSGREASAFELLRASSSWYRWLLIDAGWWLRYIVGSDRCHATKYVSHIFIHTEGACVCKPKQKKRQTTGG